MSLLSPHRMRNRSFVFLLLAAFVVAGGALLAPGLIGTGDAPVVRWSASEEIAIEAQADNADAAVAEALGTDSQREQVATADELATGDRTELLLRGRVVNRFGAPVREAKVWLDFGRGGQRVRGGRDRRVPEPVKTDADGRFAFQGQTFKNLRINLLVVHGQHAPTQFDRNLGEVGSELDLGELAVNDGGELLGRVVDLGGNGIPFAEVRLQADGDNWMRAQRDRDDVLPAQQTDANGYYRFANAASGDWRIAASAKKHENGTSEQVEASENQRTEVPDLILGPGFELAGVVMDRLGKPIADAEVVARPRNQNNNGRGGRGGRGGQFGGGGNEQSTKTDADGRFFLERLPDSLLDLTAQKKGYLRASLSELDPEQSQPVYLTLEDGLAIQGVVTDAVAGEPVQRYAVTVQWTRALSIPGQTQEDVRALMERMRDPNLDDATRNELRTRMQTMRQQMGGNGGFGGGGFGGGNDAQNGRGGRGNGGGRDARAERHPDGTFRETGLAEGIYTVRIESPAHADYRSEEIELRTGAPAPELKIALARGFVVAGIVKDGAGKPIANARVNLQRPQEPATSDAAAPASTPGAAVDATARGGRGGRGGRGADMRARFQEWQSGPLPSAVTNAKGEFQIEHAPEGTFLVRASADSHEDAETKPFALASDTQGILLALQRRGSLSGSILGATKTELEQVRVVAAPVGEGADVGAMFRGGNPFASVSADGTYVFDGLKAGDYAVRAFLGSSMRDLMTQYQRGEMVADVTIQDGEASSLDVSLMPPQTGLVRGSVLQNGVPANGFTVTLEYQPDGGDSATPSPMGGRGGRGGMGGMGARNSMNARVDEQGRFSIDEVQKGNYVLSVSADRRSTALHKETIVVVPQGTVDCNITVLTCSIEGVVEATDGTKPEDIDGAVTLLLGATEVPADFTGGGRGPGGGAQGTLRARVTDGKFALEHVPQGNYLAVVSVRGRTRTSSQVVATLGQKATARVELGPVDPNAAANPQRQPGAGRQNGGQPGTQPGAQPGGNARQNGGGARGGAQGTQGQAGGQNGGTRRGG